MRPINNIIIFALFSILALPSFAQNTFKSRLEHRIIAGFSLGATAPIPIPSEVRRISGWWPQFTPQLGYTILYTINDKWGMGSGIILDHKGMGVKDRVKYMYTEVIIEDGSDRELKGYFVGKNKTKVKLSYVTIPVYATFRLDKQWTFSAGGYASYLSSGQFNGNVTDGYLRVGSPVGEKVEITKASFDFNDDLRNFDFGLTFGAERRINDRFGIYGNFNWGLTPIFPSKFKAMEFDMYNLYLTVGLTYLL